MPISWTEQYATGEEKIDTQHQKLFCFINDVEKLSMQQHPDRAEVDRLIRFMIAYGNIHFTYEEFCMMRHQCPTYDKNIEAHNKFGQLAESFKQRCEIEGATQKSLRDLYGACASWLTNHIVKIDTHLKKCLHA